MLKWGQISKMSGNNTMSGRHRTLADHGATSMTELYIEGAILSLICIVAITGNTSLFIIIYRNRNLRTITNMFILGLSGADLFVSIANMPVTVSALFYGDWPLNDSACVALGYINMLTLVLSVLSLCNISINRFIMICRPFHFKVVYTERNAVLMLLGRYSHSIRSATLAWTLCEQQMIFIDETNMWLYSSFYFNDTFSEGNWQFRMIYMGNPSKLPS